MQSRHSAFSVSNQQRIENKLLSSMQYRKYQRHEVTSKAFSHTFRLQSRLFIFLGNGQKKYYSLLIYVNTRKQESVIFPSWENSEQKRGDTRRRRKCLLVESHIPEMMITC